MKKKWLIGLTVLSFSVVMSGCGDSNADDRRGAPEGKAMEGTAADSAPAISTEPVTLNVLTSTTELNFEAMLIEPVKKKYPHITLNVIQKGKGTSMRELVAAGQVPDLYTNWIGGMMD